MSESKFGGEGKDSAGDSGQSWEQIKFDDIEVGERIGGGGVGVIYRGYYKDQSVALKTLFDSRIGEDLKKEYMDELLVLSKVKHSNIVTFLGACMTPPNLCFVMEMCETSLFNLIHVQKARFSDREIIKHAVDVGSALEYLHSLRPAIIHRDIKSHNVLLGYDGALKLCDFGLVHVRNTQAGTPAYMAPELLENKSFNKSVDVYAFGVLLCEMFTQEVPFYGVDIQSIRERAIQGDRPNLPTYSMPPRLLRLTQQCWHASPTSRPDFSAVVDELLEVYDEVPEGKAADVMTGDALDGLLFK